MKTCPDITEYAKFEQRIGSMGGGDYLFCSNKDCSNYDSKTKICKTQGFIKKEFERDFKYARSSGLTKSLPSYFVNSPKFLELRAESHSK